MLKSKDIILITGVILISALLFIFIRSVGNNNGDKVRISIDSEIYGEYSLSEDKVIDIDSVLGHNQITIENGKAYMSEADCPDKYCMEYAPISMGNEVIICLPHKIVIEITGDTDNPKTDVIAR